MFLDSSLVEQRASRLHAEAAAERMRVRPARECPLVALLRALQARLGRPHPPVQPAGEH